MRNCDRCAAILSKLRIIGKIILTRAESDSPKKGKGPIRANGKGLLSFLRREGDESSKHFAHLLGGASTVQRCHLFGNGITSSSRSFSLSPKLFPAGIWHLLPSEAFHSRQGSRHPRETCV